MRPAFVIAAKDLRERLRDRSALMIAFVVPLALSAVFTFTLGEFAAGTVTFDVAYASEDTGELSTTLRTHVLEPLEREGLLRLRDADGLADAERLAGDGVVDAAIVVPAGFSAAVQSGSPASLQVVSDPDSPFGAQVARSIAGSFASELSAVTLAIATVASLQPEAADDPGLAERAAQTPAPIALEDITASSRVLDQRTFYAAGMAVFFLFFTVQFGISSLLDERRGATLGRLLAAPIPRGSILAGKLLVSFLLGIVSMTVLVVATSLLLDADWGNAFGVAILVVCGVVAAMGVTALIATVARTAEQAGYAQSVVALTLGMLGGAFFPVAQIGGVISTLSLFTPHAWFLRGLGEVSGGAGASAALLPAAAILGFALVTGGIALVRVDRVVAP